MEETSGTTAPNRTVIILLAVIVLLLVAIVAFFVLGDRDTGTTGTAATDTAATDTAATGMGSTGAGTTETPFDPATATRVAEGATPEQHVSAYFDAVVAGDYEGAFALLPTAKQAEYGGLDAFSQQLTGYGITTYTIDSSVEEGEEAQVTATANMAGGAFQYLWIFVKDGDGWLVKSRTLPGMGG